MPIASEAAAVEPTSTGEVATCHCSTWPESAAIVELLPVTETPAGRVMLELAGFQLVASPASNITLRALSSLRMPRIVGRLAAVAWVASLPPAPWSYHLA